MIAAKRHASIRANSARGSTAAKRRSDQDSRRLVGRRMTQAIGPGLIPQGHDGSGGGERRLDNSRRQAGEALGVAARHEDAFVASDRRRSLRRTARHVVGHLVRRGRGRHAIHHRVRRSIGRWLRHHGARQWHNNEPNDRKDHEQTTDESIKIHGPISHRIADLGREITLQIRKHN